MERARWTDEWVDDQMSAIDTTFDRVFEELRAERADMRCEMRAIRSDMSALHQQVTRVLLGFAVGLLGVVSAGMAAVVASL
jgi:hypothetical protein